MADIEVKTRKITREKLATVFKSHELITAFENLTEDVSGTLPDAIEAGTATADAALALANQLKNLSFVLIAASSVVPNERVLAVGPGLTLVDGGAGNSVTLDVAAGYSSESAVLAAAITENAGLFVDVPDFEFTMLANSTYLLDGVFEIQSNAAIPSVALGFTLPAGATIDGRYGHTADIAALTGSSAAASGTAATGATNVITGRWMIKTGATLGTAQLRFASRVATYALTLLSGKCAMQSKQIA